MVNKSSAVAEMGDRLATIDMGRKLGGGAVPLWQAELGPHVTHVAWAEACMPSFILIRPTVRQQYTNVTDRTDNGPIA